MIIVKLSLDCVHLYFSLLDMLHWCGIYTFFIVFQELSTKHTSPLSVSVQLIMFTELGANLASSLKDEQCIVLIGMLLNSQETPKLNISTNF
jgi:hypothetical protein